MSSLGTRNERKRMYLQNTGGPADRAIKGPYEPVEYRVCPYGEPGIRTMGPRLSAKKSALKVKRGTPGDPSVYAIFDKGETVSLETFFEWSCVSDYSIDRSLLASSQEWLDEAIQIVRDLDLEVDEKVTLEEAFKYIGR